MIQVTVITVGSLKESYWRDALAEYEKRLGAFCKTNIIQLKEHKLSENPSQAEIDAALAEEGRRILAAVPPRAYRIALCVEGKQLSSEELAVKMENFAASGVSEVCFLIGSSHGLDESLKRRADLRLSVSKMTFPHELFRVMLLEQLYRASEINAGSKYHK